MDGLGKKAGTVAGAIGGRPAGIPGMIVGGKLGSKVGNYLFPSDEDVDTAGNQPGYPSYIGMDPAAYAQAGAVNSGAMDQFTQEAMKTGPSTGADYALKENALKNKFGVDQSNKLAMGQSQQAQNQLAMRGGLSGGAAERVQQSAAGNALDMNQKTNADAAKNRAGILTNDAQAKMGQLGAANEMQNGAASQKLNVTQAQAAELARRNAFGLGMYDSQMKAWGAAKTADATQNSGKK